MDETIALVRSVSGAQVELEADAPACSRCAAGRGCGAGLFASSGPRRFTAMLTPGLDARPGDRVEISFSGATVLRGAVYAYGLPLAGLVTGAGGAGAVGAVDGVALLLAGAGVTVGIVCGRLLARRRDCIDALRPEIIRRVERSAPGVAAT